MSAASGISRGQAPPRFLASHPAGVFREERAIFFGRASGKESQSCTALFHNRRVFADVNVFILHLSIQLKSIKIQTEGKTFESFAFKEIYDTFSSLRAILCEL